MFDPRPISILRPPATALLRKSLNSSDPNLAGYEPLLTDRYALPNHFYALGSNELPRNSLIHR